MTELSFDDAPPAESAASAGDFFSTGSPSCRFNNVGDAHQGEVVKFEEAQQRDIKTGAPKFWPDGNKCEMLVITLQTDERDAEIDDDDGQRRLYVNKPSGLFAAIKAAVGTGKFLAGGKLAVKYTGNGKPKQAGFSPPKEYAAKYLPPGAPAPITLGSGHTSSPASSKALRTSVKIVDVKSATGTTNGQPWVKYGVVASDGRTYGTFAKGAAEFARVRVADQQVVHLEYSQDGNKLTLLEITLAGPAFQVAAPSTGSGQAGGQAEPGQDLEELDPPF